MNKEIKQELTDAFSLEKEFNKLAETKDEDPEVKSTEEGGAQAQMQMPMSLTQSSVSTGVKLLTDEEDQREA